jgi:hypothetical protein
MTPWPCTGYPACYGDGQLHDQFTLVAADIGSATTSASELDDGNGWHWRTNLQTNTGNDVVGPFNQNCMSNW